MADSFSILKTPLNMMLLCEAIAHYYPMQVCMEESINANDDTYITVQHNNGYAITDAIKEYVRLNNPHEQVR